MRYDTSLRFQPVVRHSFRQYLNDVPTPNVLQIFVDDDTGRITDIGGYAALDRGFPTAPALSYADAIACAEAYNNGRLTTDFDAEWMYKWSAERTLEPWWEVSSTTPPDSLFYLLPDGRLKSPKIIDHLPRLQDLGGCRRNELGEMIFEE